MTHAITELPAADLVPDPIRAVAEQVGRRCAEIEQQRLVPRDLLDALTAAGCLRMAVGTGHGGSGAPLPAIVATVEELSRANATVGWLMAQVALAHVVFGYLPAEAAAELYAGGPDVYAAGAAAPKGRATRIDAGWLVSGRWPLVSGCEHAAWLYLQCLWTEDGEIRSQQSGVPELRTVVVPRDAVRILDTWRGLGLRGSGSHDVQLSGYSCPADHACDLNGAPVYVSASTRIPVATQAGLVAAGVMLGIAGGAVEAVATLAAQKRASFSAERLADSTLFQYALGDASMSLAAGRALLIREIAAADRRSPDPGPASLDDGPDEARLRAVGAKAAELAATVVDRAYTLGGSSSVIDGSPLERRLRDARSLTQHATLSRDQFARYGSRLVAEPGQDRRALTEA